MGKTSCKAKNPTEWFSGHHSQESLIKNQVVTYTKNLPLTWTIPKYQPTVEPSLQYLIGLDIVKPSSYMHKSQ